MMKAIILQHVAFETPGYISNWMAEREVTSQLIRVDLGEEIPYDADIDLLVVLGGPMSANDNDPFLKQERQLIQQQLKKNRAVFGICLGAQQLAVCLGETIQSTPKEVGWGNVVDYRTNQAYTVLHWHGEGFSFPTGSTRLFYSDDWANQGFQYKRAIGLQFHLETTPTSIRAIVENDEAFLKQSILKQSAAEVMNHPIATENKELLYHLLDQLMGD